MSPDPVTISPERVLGRLRGDDPGPTLLVVGGVHGNEPSGLSAMHRIRMWLEHDAPAGAPPGTSGPLSIKPPASINRTFTSPVGRQESGREVTATIGPAKRP